MRRGKKLAKILQRRITDYEETVAGLSPEKAKAYTRPGSRPGGYPRGKAA